MVLVRFGSGSLEDFSVWYDTEMPVAPRQGEAVLIRGDDRQVLRYVAEEVGYFLENDRFIGVLVLIDGKRPVNYDSPPREIGEDGWPKEA